MMPVFKAYMEIGQSDGQSIECKFYTKERTILHYSLDDLAGT
jgi:hypothetical protein